MPDSLELEKICPSCNSKAKENFCSNCGEKIAARGYSLKEFFANILEGLFNLDSKFFRSLKYLITKPGFLTNEFLSGKTVGYMKPLQLFIVLNLIMLVNSFFFGESIFSSSLYGHKNYTPYKSFAGSITQEEPGNLDLSPQMYEQKFNARLDSYSQTLIFSFIPFVALALTAITRKRYFYENLIYSAHTFAFILLLFGLVIPLLLLIFYFFSTLGLKLSNDTIVIPTLIISLSIYFYFSIRTVYKSTRIVAVLKTILLIAFFLVAFSLYRFFLFIIVYVSLKIF